MFPFNAKLFGLLLLQLIAAASLYLYYNSDQDTQSQSALINISRQDINGIEISDSETTILVKKHNDQWQFSDWHQLPVNQAKLEAILKNLSELKSGWPIATTESSHQRFEVAEDKFQRRIKLMQDDKPVVEFFLGTSPGFRKVHFRVQGDNKVYSVPLNTYDFPTKNNDWLWKQLLAVQHIKSIDAKDFSLHKKEQDWHFKDDTDTAVDQEQAKQLVQAFNGLTVTSLVDNEVDLSSAEKISYTITNDSQYTLNFYHKEGDYFVQRNDFEPLIFKLTQFEYQRFADVSRDSLVKKETDTASSDRQNTSASTNEQTSSSTTETESSKQSTDKNHSAESQQESSNS
jgi:hypothetical protein